MFHLSPHEVVEDLTLASGVILGIYAANKFNVRTVKDTVVFIIPAFFIWLALDFIW